MSGATTLLQQYLGQLAARGVSHVRLTGAEWRKQGPPPSPLVDARPSTSTSPTQPEKRQRLDTLSVEAANCQVCRSLGSLRETMVFSTGSPDAQVMFVGEAPGAEEERQGEPFVGPAGQLLTKIILAMGFKRSDVYITNICKFRPVVDDGRPQANRNRPPTSVEMRSCIRFVTEEIRIIQPRVIVALGSSASNGLGIEGAVSRLRGQFREFQGVPVMVTYHPSYLLRCEQNADGGTQEKRLVWEDMLQVLGRLGLAVSAKQRAYFTKAGS